MSAAAVLEQKILDGENVTPEQLVEARMSDDAATRIAELTHQREVDAATQLRLEEAATRNAATGERLKALAEDETFKAIAGKMNELISEYSQRAAVHNSEIREIRQEVRSTIAFAPDAPTVIGSDDIGSLLEMGPYSVKNVPNWQIDVRRIVENGLAAVRA